MDAKTNEEPTDGQDEEPVVNLNLIPESKVSRNELVYACQFYVSPELRNYYYVPDPSVVALANGKQVLYTVPEFSAAFGSKWQVGICLHNWVEVTRWVSLYLTRVDEPTVYSAPIQLQCEFRIVDGIRTALHSRQSEFTLTMPGDMGGFAQFVPFKRALTMLSPDGFLHVEAHMMLILETSLTQMIPDLSEKVESAQASLNLAQSEKKERAPEATSCLDADNPFVSKNNVEDYEVNRPSFYPDGLEEDATVLFILDGEVVGAANREKLSELSEHYNKCRESDPSKFWDKMEFRRRGSSPSMSYINWMTIHQYLQYVEDQSTDIHDIGTFEDLRQLFEVAKKLETMDLMAHCVYGMCNQATLMNSPLFVSFLKEYPDMIKACWSDGVHEFRKYFQRNFKTIQKDPILKEMINFEKEWFMEFLFHPGLEYD